MVVQHNLTAMNSNRMLGITTGSQAKSTEKLSSGYKINRAADDAAGLSISEKMRKQIRGLSQASLNAEDGISAVQTAEGALNEVQDMLQRMNELAVKAANGTNSTDDRNYIQDEIDQLVIEIDRVATTTKFNESYLLKGTNADGTDGKLSYATAAAATADIDGLGAANSVTFDEMGNGTATVAKGAQTTSTLDGSTGTATKYNDTKFQIGDVTYHLVSDIVKGSDGTNDVTTTLGELAELLEADAVANNKTDKFFTDLDSLEAAIKTNDFKELSIAQEGANYKVSLKAFADTNDALSFSLHVGADSTADNKIEVNIEMMSARGLGVNGLLVNGIDDANATAAIDTITAAIQKVSTQRSALGAVQNRLEHTIANLDNVVENTTAAESQIRDTDMATEMVRYSNNNILAQAGQAMLAQANQANQGVLSLLG